MKKVVWSSFLLVIFGVKASATGRPSVAGEVARGVVKTAVKPIHYAADIAQTPIRAARFAKDVLRHPYQSAKVVMKGIILPRSLELPTRLKRYRDNFSASKGQTSLSKGADIVGPIYRIGRDVGNAYKSVRSAISPKYAAEREIEKMKGHNFLKKSVRVHNFNRKDLEQRIKIRDKILSSDDVEYFLNDPKKSNNPAAKDKIVGQFNDANHKAGVKAFLNEEDLKQGNYSIVTELNNPIEDPVKLKNTIFMNNNLRKSALDAAKNISWATRLFNRDKLKADIKKAIYDTDRASEPENF